MSTNNDAETWGNPWGLKPAPPTEFIARQKLDAGVRTALVPTGALLSFAAGDAPDGFVNCDGTSYRTEEYPALFAVIGYTYGGSGENFNVPNVVENIIKT